VSDAILFVTGASGAGKTAAMELLAGRELWRNCCHFFDSVGVPSAEEMDEKYRGGRSWQRETIALWIERLVAADESVSILEGQMRPSWIQDALAENSVSRSAILLLDCEDGVREHRLTELREQPDLANADMFKWAAYLKGQADAFDLPVLDTSALPLNGVADEIARWAEALNGERRADEYEDQLFEVFYQSQLRQKVELDRHHKADDAFRVAERRHFDIWRSDPEAHWVVIEREGGPVGYAATDYNPETRGFGIGNLGIRRDWRRRAIGMELLQKVIAEAEARGSHG